MGIDETEKKENEEEEEEEEEEREEREKLVSSRACSPRALSALARHWMRAGEDARALRCLDLAGTRAAAAGESGDVVVVLTQALDMLREERRRGNGAREARWLRLLGEARRAMGDDACAADFRAAVAIAEDEDDEDEREDAADGHLYRLCSRRGSSVGCVGVARRGAPRMTRSVAREVAALTWRWKTESAFARRESTGKTGKTGNRNAYARLREGTLASAALRDVTRSPRDAIAAVAVAERLVDAARVQVHERVARRSREVQFAEASDLLASALDVAVSLLASRRAGRFGARLDAVLAGLFRRRARAVRDARKTFEQSSGRKTLEQSSGPATDGNRRT